MRIARMFDAARNAGQCSLVKDKLHAFHRAGNNGHVGEIPHQELHALGYLTEILARSAREIVEHAHAVAARDESIDDVRANKSGAASDQAVCHFLLSLPEKPLIN